MQAVTWTLYRALTQSLCALMPAGSWAIYCDPMIFLSNAQASSSRCAAWSRTRLAQRDAALWLAIGREDVYMARRAQSARASKSAMVQLVLLSWLWASPARNHQQDDQDRCSPAACPHRCLHCLGMPSLPANGRSPMQSNAEQGQSSTAVLRGLLYHACVCVWRQCSLTLQSYPGVFVT